jgi:hypothetical protein
MSKCIKVSHAHIMSKCQERLPRMIFSFRENMFGCHVMSLCIPDGRAQRDTTLTRNPAFPAIPPTGMKP